MVSFSTGGANEIMKQRACAAEIHPNTDVFHYQLCIQLNCQRRFKQAAMNLKVKYAIYIGFQSWITIYYDAFMYVKNGYTLLC